jgi:NADH-quinone oxidoreductase subunit N
MIENLQYLSPEIFLAISAMILLMIGVFSKCEKVTKNLFTIGSIVIFTTIYILYHYSLISTGLNINLFANSFVFDSFAYSLKMIAALTVIIIFVIAGNTPNFAGPGNQKLFEFPVLMLLSLIGIFLLISANDMLVFYVGLELTSLATYVLVAINRDSERSTEAGVKYFILGALASGIILFGISLIYGFLKTTNLSELTQLLLENSSIQEIPQAAILGVVLVLSGLFFKISAVPMHMWAPDVYEGATKTVLAFISTAPKIGALAFLIRFINSLSGEFLTSIALIIAFVSAASMILGAFAALKQENIKRLFAYSSIANIGYILIAISIGDKAAFEAAILYLVIYLATILGIFLILAVLNKAGDEVEQVSELAGLHKINPFYAFSITVLLFSVAGIPPMTGFFGKLYVFLEALQKELYVLAVIGVVSSVVACFYYLRIIKTIYFDEADVKISKLPALKKNPFFRMTVAATVIFSLFGVLLINYIKEIAQIATSSL